MTSYYGNKGPEAKYKQALLLCTVLVQADKVICKSVMESVQSHVEYSEGEGAGGGTLDTRESRIAARRKRVMMKIEARHRAAQGKDPTSVS
jgi:hypothetical protein